MSLADLAAWRAYLWPGSDVLSNKLDIRDPAKLAEAEALLTTQRLEEGAPIVANTPDGYCAIHRHIFQDLYTWAGAYRTANMRHPAHAAFFCKTAFIAEQMETTFAAIRDLAAGDLGSAAGFAAALAAPLGDLNAIHPFRDGNGRAMREFIAQLAVAHGLVFDQTKLDAAQWHEASRVSFMTGDAAPLEAVLLTGLERARDRE